MTSPLENTGIEKWHKVDIELLGGGGGGIEMYVKSFHEGVSTQACPKHSSTIVLRKFIYIYIQSPAIIWEL